MRGRIFVVFNFRVMICLLIFSFSTLLSNVEWTPTYDVSKKGVETFEIAKQPNGKIQAVWFRTEYSGGKFVRKYLETSQKFQCENWSAPEVIESGDFLERTNRSSKKSLSIVLDSEGDPSVFLSKNSVDLGFCAYAKQKFANGLWSEWSELSFPYERYTEFPFPEVAVDGIGTLYAVRSVCQRELGASRSEWKVEVCEKKEGGEWCDPTYLNNTSQYYYHEENPKIKSDNTGNVYCVWEGYNERTPTIKCSEKPLGGQWTAPIDISLDKGYIYNSKLTGRFPKVAIGHENDVVVAWNEKKPGGRIHLARRLSENYWSTALPISSSNPSCLAKSCLVEVDGKGDAVIAWLQTEDDPATSGDWNIFSKPKRVMSLSVANISKDNKLLGTTRLLSIPNRGCDLREGIGFNSNVEQNYINSFAIAVDDKGNAVAVWGLRLGRTDALQAATKSVLGKWSKPVDLASSDKKEIFNVEIAADRKGNFHVLWLEGFWRNGQLKYKSMRFTK